MRRGIVWTIFGGLVLFAILLIFLDYIAVDIPFGQLFGEGISELREFFTEIKGVGGQ